MKGNALTMLPLASTRHSGITSLCARLPAVYPSALKISVAFRHCLRPAAAPYRVMVVFTGDLRRLRNTPEVEHGLSLPRECQQMSMCGWKIVRYLVGSAQEDAGRKDLGL